MNAEQNPLLRYDSLLQQYTDRVEPLLTQLRDRVDNELNLICHQEATLLADRTQALQELQTAIGVDAMFWKLDCLQLNRPSRSRSNING